MVFAIGLSRPGDAGVLAVVRQTPVLPGPGEVRLRQVYAGVNFVDIYLRDGLYPLPQLPAVLGVEGAGVVDAVGPDVIGVAVGDRVAYAAPPTGGYATSRLLPAWRCVPLPDRIDFRTGAAMMLRGMTAHMLLTTVRPVGPGTTLFVQAVAGGLGSIVAAWAKRLGARVIGTAGGAEKTAIARAAGVDAVIDYKAEDFVAALRDLTDGALADMAIDGIGGDTLARTLDCVRPFGLVASVGQAAGPIPPLTVEALGPTRSIALARPSVFRYAAEPARYARAAAAVAAAVADGLPIAIGAVHPLAAAATAHRALAAGQTHGAILLDCETADG